MELSKRLSTVAAMVKETSSADIGTDHGYLPIYLIKEKGLKKVIACDINKGPIKTAEENIKSFGVSDFIETRLGNGLEKVKPNEVECITISGMGGMLIISILENGIDTVKTAKRLVLSPQHDIPKVRQYIFDIGFKIEDEEMVFEDGKYYTIINAVKGADAPYDEKELMFGRKLIEKKSTVLKNYVEFQIKKIEKILGKIEKNSGMYSERANELSLEHKLCKEVLEWL